MRRDVFDFIVVGAGTAGCIVAARLCKANSHSVALVEAGPDPSRLSRSLTHVTSLVGEFDWRYRTTPDNGVPSLALPAGKIVGGSSRTNFGIATRPPREDFESWAQFGGEMWSWRSVLPYFRRIETDSDFDTQEHGSNGPIVIRRYPQDRWVPVQAAFFSSAANLGIRTVSDLNSSSHAGVGPCPLNAEWTRRVSVDESYLRPMLGHGNLTVLAEREVIRINLTGDRADGITCRHPDGEVSQLTARRGVIICCGAPGSPALLMRSGIGPAKVLKRANVVIRVNVESVGFGIADHPCLTITSVLRDGVGEKTDPLFQTLMRLASDGDPTTFDLHVLPRSSSSKTKGLPKKRFAFFLFVGLMSPKSRGSIEITSGDSAASLWIDPGYGREQTDIERLSVGLAQARELLATRPLSTMIESELRPGSSLPKDSNTAQIRQAIGSYHHLIGGCALGRDVRDGAVVSPDLRVFGLDNLWIADASVMPEIPRANTNLTVAMIAERCADFVLNGSDPGMAERT